MAAARLSSHDPESGGCCLCSSPLSFHSGTGSERPGAVQGAPLFGAAERTLDGEDRSEIITEGRKGACFRLLRTHYRPIIPEINTWASRPGPARPRAIGRLGAAACTIRSQRRQLSFGVHDESPESIPASTP